MKTAETPHAGLVLADEQYEVAATRHLQYRLRILYGVMAGAALFFTLIEHALPLCAGTWTLHNLTKPGALVQVSIVLVTAGLFLRLRAAPVSRPVLRVLDAMALYLGAGACLMVYALLFKEGPRDIVAVTAMFVIARAIVIPSSPWTTLLLSLPIPLALLVIDVSHGTAWSYDERELTDPEVVTSVRVWNQVVLLFGIGVATVASRLNSLLRARLEQAHRLGQYHLDEKIGQGGMGEVYLATHATLKRPTAVKLLRPEIMGEEAIARFDREVRLASRLTHPNTIRIFDYGRTPEGVFYYAMEHVHGQDLSSIVQRHGPLPPGRVVHVLESLCRSLAEAHELGLVHRDVKPNNVMLCTKGGECDVVKLVDFGLAKDLADAETVAEVPGTVCGSPETIAPETLRGKPATPAGDLYALGAVGIYLLTGKPIFDAATPIGLLSAHLDRAPISPTERGFQVPADLERLLLRCLSKDPAGRPASATELARELRACNGVPPWTPADAAAWWARFGGLGVAREASQGATPGKRGG